ncbi:hypothetical protein [Sphingomonas carotinifaciens]|nr:hypothetical protein [Sphingomonas carotinifaciens]
MPQKTAELRRLLDDALAAADKIDPVVAAYIAQARALVDSLKDQSNSR